MATMTPTAPNTAALVTKLQAHLASLGDGRDCKSENEQVTYRRSYDAVQSTISGLRDLPDDIAWLTARIDAVVARRDAVLAKVQEFELAIAGFTDWRLVADARERDKEWDRQHQTRRGLERLREGTLLQAPGVTFERLADLDKQIKELTQRRDRAQSALDGHLKAAEQLLAVTS